jgi:hypothetical protein
MKKAPKILLLITLLLFFNNLFSQSITFKKVYTGFSIYPAYLVRLLCKPMNNDKSFILSGASFSLSSTPLIKLDMNGNIISKTDFAGIGGDLVDFIIQDSRIIVYGNGEFSKNLSQYDTSLNIFFAKEYGMFLSGQPYSVTDHTKIYSTFDNGYIHSATKSRYDTAAIFKTDNAGNVLWGKYFINVLGSIEDIIQTQDSGYAIALNIVNPGVITIMAAGIVKTDKNGNVLWAKAYIRPRGYIHNVLENDDGSLIITGNMGDLDAGTNSSPLFLTKLDQNGNVLWAKTFGDATNNIMNYPTSTKHTLDGGYITLATQTNPIPNEDIIMIKLDANGDTMWVRAHGSPQSLESNQSIEQLNDGGYIFCGTTNNNIPVNHSSLYLVRTDSLGHTGSFCEEYSPTIAINNITVNDSNINATSVPFTITTSIPDTSTQSFTTNAYDGCYLDEIPELFTEQTALLLIYPNPTDGLFSIEMKMNTSIKTDIEIYNINGRKIFSGNTSESHTDIDLMRYARGLYFVRMSNERFVKTGKVMVY